ncbi:MAG: YcgL domain-containing protein, partial [Congregibacter sp.]|nr:YcgL domain-containing protein [Congregibacter sp.]
ALVLALEPGRKLALADAAAVIAALEEPGYYVQMPPGRRSAAGPRDDDPDALQNALMAPIQRFEA